MERESMSTSNKIRVVPFSLFSPCISNEKYAPKHYKPLLELIEAADGTCSIIKMAPLVNFHPRFRLYIRKIQENH